MRYIALFFFSIVSLFSHALDFKSPFQSEPEFLPVEQAFSFSFTPNNDNNVELVWDIAEGYYLYQHQFKVEEASNTDANIRFATLPQGKEKTDPYFGDVIVYRDQLKTKLIYDTVDAGTELSLNVTYQGCADRGLCYPPQTLPLKVITTNNTVASSSPLADLSPQPSQANQVITLLQEGGLFVSLLTLFGLGLLLSLTPCVLPMIPIVSAIVIGDKTSVVGDKTAWHSAWKGFYYSALYVLAMAATYASFGAIAGYFGTQLNIQAHLQSPVVLATSIIVFVALALAMFGVYELRLPSFIETKLNTIGTTNKGYKSVSIVLMGVLATLVVSPCVSAPLAGVIFFISAQGDAVYGAIMLFVMALGMGVPLLLVGLFGPKVLPKSGEWLNDIKVIMGFALLAVAIWLTDRWDIGSYYLYLWSLFCLFLGSYFFIRHTALKQHSLYQANPIRLALAITLLLFGTMQALGGASGSKNVFMPLSQFGSSISAPSKQLNFATVYSLNDLDQVKKANSNSSTPKPILLDLYADWCISCKVIEEEIFLADDVSPLLEQFLLVKADVTKNSIENKKLMKQYGLYGPPSLLFFSANGNLSQSMTLIGEPSKQEVIERLSYILNNSSKEQADPKFTKD